MHARVSRVSSVKSAANSLDPAQFRSSKHGKMQKVATSGSVAETWSPDVDLVAPSGQGMALIPTVLSPSLGPASPGEDPLVLDLSGTPTEVSKTKSGSGGVSPGGRKSTQRSFSRLSSRLSVSLGLGSHRGSVVSNASILTSNMLRAFNTIRPEEELSVQDVAPFLKMHEVDRTIGKGSYGTVQLIRAKGSKKVFAMKSVTQNRHTNAELSIFKMLDNPYIVRLHHILQQETETTEDQSGKGKIIYFVMDYCAGGDLITWMKLRSESPLRGAPKLYRHPDSWLASGILWQMLVGIGYLHHNKIVHRDVKPENYLIRDEVVEEDGMVKLKLSDFGLANKLSKHGRLNDTAGSLPYMAPEIFTGPSYGSGVDIFGVGGCIYFVVCDAYWFVDPQAAEAKSPEKDADLSKWIEDQIVSNTVSFRHPAWHQHPSELQQIIALLLHKDESVRPNAKELVATNKWLRANAKTAAEEGGCCCSIH